MPITIKTNQIKYKDSNGEYQGFNAIAQESTAQQIENIETAGQTQIAAVQQKGAETLATIPNDYTEIAGDVTDLKSQLNYIADDIDTYLVTDNVLYKRDVFTVGVAGGTYQRANFYAVHEDTFTAGDYYTFLCDSIVNNTAAAMRYRVMCGDTEIRSGSNPSVTATSVSVQITASDIDANVDSIIFYVYASTTTALTAPCVLTNPKVIKGIAVIAKTYSNAFKNAVTLETKNQLGVLTLGDLVDGYVISTNGNFNDANSYKRTGYIVMHAKKICITITANATNVGLAFYNISKAYTGGVNFGLYSIGDVITVDVPQDTEYLVYCALNAQANNMRIIIPNYADAFSIDSKTDIIENDIKNTLGVLALGTLEDGYVAYTGALNPGSAYKRTTYIPIKSAKITVTITTTTNGVGLAFYDNAKNCVGGLNFGTYSIGDQVTIDVPDYAEYLVYCAINANVSKMQIVIPNYANAVSRKIDNPCLWTESSECGVFKKILCIGDSLTDGQFDYKENGVTKEFNDRDYAYPAFLKALTGRDVTNAGDAGETTVSWYAAHGSENFSGHDACIIHLGRNDYAGGNSISPEERIAAMNNIIAKVKTDNPQIKIFVSTQINYYNYTNVGTINADMATVVEQNTDCYLLDIYTYGRMTQKRDMHSHCTAVGYKTLAEYYHNYISYIMHTEWADFKTVQFTGTDRAYT